MKTNLKTDELTASLTRALRGLRLSALEMVFLAAALIFTAVVIYFHLTQSQPRVDHLAELRSRYARAQATLKQANTERQQVEEQRANAERILDSLRDFESHLKDSKHGITGIIDEVNSLAQTNRVSAGEINYRPNEPDQLPGDGAASGTASPTPTVSHSGKPVKVYEGLGIDTTVEGDYHDLRRFISDLEHSKQFVIINAIALQGIEEKAGRTPRRTNRPVVPGAATMGGPNMPVAGRMNRPGGQAVPPLPNPMSIQPGQVVPPAITVSLKIEMQTYFQREGGADLLVNPVPAVAPAKR